MKKEEYVLHLVEEGRLSIGKAAELLQRTIYDLHLIAQKHGIELGATKEQAKKSREVAEKIL